MSPNPAALNLISPSTNPESLIEVRRTNRLEVDNGCELSGRGSLHHLVFLEPAVALSLASSAASPVRSSEGLGDRAHRRVELAGKQESDQVVDLVLRQHI
jgi:hypothetical protein